jgi:hypothetical protein
MKSTPTTFSDAIGHDWSQLRGLAGEAILDVLGARRYGDHRLCPRCFSLFQVCDDPDYGVSVRCTREACLLGSWSWPEHAIVRLTGCTVDQAQKRLLEAHPEHRHRRAVALTVKEARAVVRRFVSA